MQHTFYNGITATLTDDALKLEATKAIGRASLGGRERTMLFDEIIAVELREPKALINGALIVATAAGRSELIFLKKHREAATLLHQEILGRVVPIEPSADGQRTWNGAADAAAAQQEVLEQRMALAKAEAAAKKEADRERRAEEKAQAKAAAEAREEAKLKKYGAIIARETFAGYFVDVYANGYIAYGFAHYGKPRKLLGIEAQTDVWKKTGLGRAVGYVTTAGINMLGPNMRGDAYLTIVTEDGVKKLHESPPRSSSVKSMYAIEAAGKVAIETARNQKS